MDLLSGNGHDRRGRCAGATYEGSEGPGKKATVSDSSCPLWQHFVFPQFVVCVLHKTLLVNNINALLPIPVMPTW